MATYPTSPSLPAGDAVTELNPTNWNTLIDNINAIGADLVDARGDGQAFPGTDHAAAQATDIDDIIQAIKHMIFNITGETNWYDEPSIALSDLPKSKAIVIDPEYPSAVDTLSLRGAAASGANAGTHDVGVSVVSNVSRNYYEWTSSETSLQDEYICVLIRLPDDFGDFAVSDALLIQYLTESAVVLNCGVNIYLYQSGDATQVGSSENNVSASWSTITIDDSILKSAHSWSAGDILEIYIKLESKNDYYARVGRITLNYTVVNTY